MGVGADATGCVGAVPQEKKPVGVLKIKTTSSNFISALLVYDANVILRARINFEVAGKLTAESCDLDGLAGACLCS